MSVKNEMIDIYNEKLFEVKGFHSLEQDPANQIFFRWSDSDIEIKPKKELKNILLNFLCIGEDKKIIIFLENSIKNTKHVFNLKNGGEYILGIDICDYDNIHILITPNVKLNNQDVRTLGVYVKRLYSNSIDIVNLQLIEKSNINYELYLDELEYHFKNPDLEEKSILEQQPNISLLPFNYSSKNFIFNSAIFNFKNKKYLFARKSSFVTKYITDNTLKLYDFDTLEEIPITIKDEVDFEQYEDPRVFVYDNKIFVSCVNYTHDKFHLIHQKILVFDENFNHIKNIHPKYKFNGKTIAENTGKEKNWTFFINKNRLFCIYSIDPHVVVEFDWNGDIKAEYITYPYQKNGWVYGICRGGSNPILHDGLMHSFFHSSIPWGEGKRRYLMGRYSFETEPPFEIVSISNAPILWGNEIDERILKNINPLVVFPCGSIVEKDKILVSFGFNDEKTGIIKI